MTAEIDRRRVLQGVAWATPAVLVATAVPASAASNTVQSVTAGGLIIVSQSAVYASNVLTVKAEVAHTGASGSAPVTGLKATIVFSSRYNMPNQPPTSVGSGWRYDNYTFTSEGKIVFNFTYLGADLTTANTGSAPLQATFAGWPTYLTSIQVGAAGTSMNIPVAATANTTATQTASVGWNSAGNYNQGQYSFELRHAGPYDPPAAAATALELTATYNSQKVSAPTQTTVGNWRVTPLGVANGVGTVRFTYIPASLAINSSTGSATALFSLINGNTKAAITFTGTYTSAGVSGTVPSMTIGSN